MELIFFTPIFKERIWGGQKLHEEYGFDILSKTTGEAWTLSAHSDGETVVANGYYKGTPLSKLWHNHPELFGVATTRDFPLLIKILDAKEDLSVQVHPNDSYALQHENDLGKAECWYVLDSKPQAQIIYGHNAQNKQQLIDMVHNQEWSKLLRYQNVTKNDIYDVPVGTIHALLGGSLILEVQQSSNTTYRIYDYDRKDAEGNKRELHLSKALDVINAPDIKTDQLISPSLVINQLQLLISNEHFNVRRFINQGTNTLSRDYPYLIISILESNNAYINNVKITKGDTILVSNEITQLEISGETSLIITSEATNN